MLCMTCKIDVPPAFKLAIEKNQCPGCWGPILDEKHQELLKELAEAMSKMEGDPQGLAGWLISSCPFKIIAKLKNFNICFFYFMFYFITFNFCFSSII